MHDALVDGQDGISDAARNATGTAVASPEASSADYLIETIQYVLDTLVSSLFGSCLGSNSSFYGYIAGDGPEDEALVLEQVRQAQNNLKLAIDQEIAAKARFDKKSASAGIELAHLSGKDPH